MLRWLRANLFSSIPQRIISLLLLAVLAKVHRSASCSGASANAVWSVPGNDSSACRAVRGVGACWAMIPEKYRFILFGTYPFDAAVAAGARRSLLFIALFYLSAMRRFWRRELVLILARCAGR